MWILHPNVGFLSAVAKPWNNGTLTVRARVRADLERLRALMPECGSIVESEDSDYRYRVVSDKAAFAECAAQLVRDIDYDNFKNAVARKEGYRRAGIYGDVWADLLKLQAL